LPHGTVMPGRRATEDASAIGLANGAPKPAL
jgi:hypothetical protein